MMTKQVDRYWQRVERKGPNDCWPWTGCTIKQGTARENAVDAVMKGRHYLASQQVCKRGHRFADNVRQQQGKWRECAECHRLRNRAYAKRQREKKVEAPV